MKRILLIEDDVGFRGMLERLLRRRDYAVEATGSGAEGLALAGRNAPDLIIADWALGSGAQGIDICLRLKKDPRTRSLPIVILTGARTGFEDELSALGHGADLYLTKQDAVGGREKTAHFLGYVKALLRRPFRVHNDRRDQVSFNGLHIDAASHTVKTSYGLISDLPTKQFDLLYLLARRYPRAVSRRHIARILWRNQVKDRCVDVAISRLRSRIEKGKHQVIESVLRRGYRLRIDPSFSASKSG